MGEPGGDVPDPVAECVRVGFPQVRIVVVAQEAGPGGQVGGDVRGDDPAFVDLPGFRGEVAQAHGLGGADAARLDDGVLPDLKALIERFRPKGMALPVVIVTLPSLAIYDQIAATVGEAA